MPRTILCRRGIYAVEHEYEYCYLTWPGGSLLIDEHYGDPVGAVLSEDGWCVIGGEGLGVILFERGLPVPGRRFDPTDVTQKELWRRANPPPSGDKCWFVENLWFAGPYRVRAVVDPQNPHAGTYEVDVRSLTWTRV
jgi:hypothetical protein